MKKFLKTLLFVAVFTALMIPYAFADVAAGPMIAAMIGIPVLIVAVIIIVAVVLLQVIKKNKK